MHFRPLPPTEVDSVLVYPSGDIGCGRTGHGVPAPVFGPVLSPDSGCPIYIARATDYPLDFARACEMHPGGPGQPAYVCHATRGSDALLAEAGWTEPAYLRDAPSGRERGGYGA